MKLLEVSCPRMDVTLETMAELRAGPGLTRGGSILPQELQPDPLMRSLEASGRAKVVGQLFCPPCFARLTNAYM